MHVDLDASHVEAQHWTQHLFGVEREQGYSTSLGFPDREPSGDLPEVLCGVPEKKRRLFRACLMKDVIPEDDILHTRS